MAGDFFVTTIGYFPSVEVFVLGENYSKWKVEAHEHYQKTGLRNKCCIVGSQGRCTLSIPLEQGRNNGLPIREVKISNTVNWQKQHWQTIRTNYGKSPFFIHYAPYFEAFYQKGHQYLFDLCIESTALLIKLLKLDVSPEPTKDFIRHYEGEGILDFRFPKTANSFVKIIHQPYPQVFSDRHGFTENLSAIDILFCLGTDAKKILKKSKIMYL